MSAPVRLPEGYAYVTDHVGQECQRVVWVGDGPEPATEPARESETR